MSNQKNTAKNHSAKAHFPYLLSDRPSPCTENLNYLISNSTEIKKIGSRYYLFFDNSCCAILNNPDDIYFEFINFTKESSLYKRILSSLAKHKFYAPVRTASFLSEINQGFICELIDQAEGDCHEN
jgi:hypothetical protein